MADFVEKTTVKSAVRELAAPIADVATFDAIVQSVIDSNPFGCVSYVISGVTHPPVEKTREYYTARIVYEGAGFATTGTGSHKFNSVAGFNAGAAVLMAAADLTAAHTGTAVRDAESDSYSATLKCRDPNGELYNVVFSRDKVSVNSYSDDAIVAKVETWADTVTELA